MISTDRLILEEGSAVRVRQIEYAKEWEEVHIIVFEQGRSCPRKPDLALTPTPIQISPNCWVYSTQSNSKFLMPFDAIKIGRVIIARREISEITCQDSSLTAMAGVSLKKQFKIPLEIQIHEDLGSPYYAYNSTNKVRKYLARKYIPQADKIRVVSERIKIYVEGLLDQRLGMRWRTNNSPKIEVRPIKVNIESIKSAPIIDGADLHKLYPQFQKIVIMASRLEKEKNIELAIEAWPAVIKAIPHAGLIIVGRGSLTSYLLALSSNLDLGSSVILKDWALPTTLASYYKTADLFLNTSLFEGYGMTLVEAQAAGCPIISTDVGVAREVGAKITTYDKDQVARDIIEVLNQNDSKN